MIIEPVDLEPIIKLLDNLEIPINYDRGRKLGKSTGKWKTWNGSKNPPGVGRSVLVGYNPMKNTELTKFTKRYPDLYGELKTFSKKYVPYPIQNFMVNKNYQTQPHYDNKNKGTSMICSFGEYTGGELIVEGEALDTYMKMCEMDGGKQLHWNLPITSGTKYSIVFFRHNKKEIIDLNKV